MRRKRRITLAVLSVPNPSQVLDSWGWVRDRKQLPGSKGVRPEYRDLHAHVLQEVLHQLD